LALFGAVLLIASRRLERRGLRMLRTKTYEE
jgi:hypothetical protein